MTKFQATVCLLLTVAMLPAGKAAAQLPSGTWQLLWADEFSRSSLDTVKGWTPNYPWGNTHNHDAYMSADNLSFGDGTLTITAERKAQGGKPFTSGAVSTGYTNFTVNGGYIEARILLPDTPGSWPAFWGLYSDWPPEMDIMEYPIDTAAGSCCGQDQYNTAFHYVNSSGGNSSGGALVNPSGIGDLGGAYHNFAVKWVEDTSVTFYFDGQQVSSFSSGADVAEMVYMYLILNYAVGGWPGAPNTSEWPNGHTDQMKVDWVRIWKETGTRTVSWTGTSGNAWDSSSNWGGSSAPDLGGVTANFPTIAASTQTIDWSGERTISHLNFTGSTSYTIGFSNDRLLLVGSNNASTDATITVQASSTVSHTLRAETELWSTLSVTNNSAQPLVLSGQFFGNRGINVDGVGPVVFANTNIYTGDTVIDSGTQGPGIARVTSSNAFGTGSVVIGTAGNSTSGRLELENNATVPNAISLNGRNNNGQELVGILNRSGNNTLSGTISANVGGSVYQIQSDAGLLTLSGLTGGGVALRAGASGSRTFTLQGAGDGLVSGNIQNGSGTVSIIKAGAGTWTLTGTNTYTGSTTVNEGTLVLRHGGTTSVIDVAAGATLDIRGNLTTGGALATSGTVDLTDGALNTLSTASVTLTSSMLNFDLGGGTNADRIAASGAATLAGTNTVNLDTVAGQSVVPGSSYNLITASAGLSAANFALGTKPASMGFIQFNLSTPTAGALVLTATGNPTPATAYWTGQGSTASADLANNWGAGATISTSNWSTEAAGTTDPLQLPGATTNVVFTAANATGSGGMMTTQLDSPYTVKGLIFDVPATTAITATELNTNGNPLTVGTSGVSLAASSNSSATVSGSGPIVLNGNQSWANNSSSRLLNISTVISALVGPTTLTINGTGAGGVDVSGVIADGGGTLSTVFNQAGTTTLSAANTYSGTTTVAGGVVELTSTGRIIGNSTIASGGTLRLSGGTDSIADTAVVNVQSGGTLDIRGSSAGIAKTETFSTLTGGGTITRTNNGLSTLTLGAGNASSEFSGSIQNGSGQLALVKTGTGTLTLSGPSTFSGGTTINDGAGAVLVTHSGALGNGNVTIGNGNTNATGVLKLSGGIAVNTVPTINFGSRNLSSDGGAADIENVSGDNSLSANFNINMTGGSAVNVLATAGTLTLTGNMTSTGLSSPRGYNFYGPANGVASGNISNGTSQPTFVQKDGIGTWTLSGSNTYTGGTTINAGTLVMASPNALGSSSSPVTMGGGATLVVQTNGSDFPYNLNVGSSNTINLVSDIKVGSVGINHTLGTLAIGRDTFVNVAAGANVASGAPAITLGNIMLSSGVGAGSTTFNPTTARLTLGAVTTSTNTAKTLVLDGTSTGNTVTGVISNGSNVVSVTKSNNSTWTLSAANTYTGVTTVSGGALNFSGAGSIVSSSSYVVSENGVLQVNASGRLGSAAINISSGGATPGTQNRLEVSGNSTLANAITLAQRNNPSDAIRSTGGNNSLSGPITIAAGGNQARIQVDAGQLTLAGPVTTNATSARNLYLQGAANGVANGVISDNSSSAAGVVNVWKEGAGRWTLGTTNTYTGTTTVSEGTLLVNGSTGTGLTSVAASATLGGSGQVKGGLASNGRIAPGTSAGTLTVLGNYTQNAGATLDIELGGTSPGEFDVLNVTGAANLAGSLNVSLINGFTPPPSSVFQFLNAASVSGSLDVSGTPSGYSLRQNPAGLALVFLPGDYDRNGTVNAADYDVWRIAFDATGNPAADGNGDGTVDAADFVLWRKYDGTTAPATAGALISTNGAVPEPGAALLALLAAWPLFHRPVSRVRVL